MKIIFAPEVRVYLKELSELLYEKNYFGFEEVAYKYVEDFVLDILDSLPNKLKKKFLLISTGMGKTCHMYLQKE